jgi:hypothetical protein
MHHRECQTPHLHRHLLPSPRFLHLPLEHERLTVPHPCPNLRHYNRCTATHMIVFNLNALVLVFSTVYESHKASLIASMKSEIGSEYWKERGERFENF